MCDKKNVEYFRMKIQFELDFLLEMKEQNTSNLENLKSIIFNKTGSSDIFGNIREIQHLMIS